MNNLTLFIKFVENLTYLMNKKESTLIVILTTGLLHEIHIAKSLLASHGIIGYIVDENIDLVYGRSLSEGYKLKINISDKEKTDEILKELGFN